MATVPLVTVITPSLNQGRFIEATIESVLSQDYPRIEYIVMDGGSTDGTLDILARYEGRLQWVSEPDRGQAHAINKGFRRARGEIVAWLNSDDTYLPGAVSAAVGHMVEHRACAMVYGDGYLIDECGRVIRRFSATEPFNLWKLVYVLDYILQQTAFFRREALASVGYLDEALNWAMDWDLFVRLGKRFPVEYVPREMANLREYATAKTLSGGRRRLAELLAVMRRHGVRRYPPAYLAYGTDTYFRLAFACARRWLPVRLGSLLRRVETALERPVYGAVNRLCREAQGFYADGWLSGAAHFLLPVPPGATALVVRGALPIAHGSGRPTSVVARAGGRRLGARTIDAPGDFELSWTLPGELRAAEALDVEFRTRPTFRPSRNPLAGDHRRLSFRLKSLSID